MNSVARSLAFAFAGVLHPRMLWLMVWPVMVAILVWGTVAIVYWTQLALKLAAIVEPWLQSATFFISWDAGDAALFAAKVLILLMLVPIIQLTALVILALFGMPAMVEHVAARRYPQLARLRGGSFAGSVLNSFVALAGLVVLGVVSIPFWIFPPLWPLIPVAILGWVNQRLLRYDALAEHARAEEMRTIFATQRGALYLMGFLLALLAYVPVLGLFAPVLFGLAFIHYLLAELQALRTAPIEGAAAKAA
jgi:hypothetical protein